jgi:hypothetical protein
MFCDAAQRRATRLLVGRFARTTSLPGRILPVGAWTTPPARRVVVDVGPATTVPVSTIAETAAAAQDHRCRQRRTSQKQRTPFHPASLLLRLLAEQSAAAENGSHIASPRQRRSTDPFFNWLDRLPVRRSKNPPAANRSSEAIFIDRMFVRD